MIAQLQIQKFDHVNKIKNIISNSQVTYECEVEAYLDAIIEETFGLGTLNDPSTRFALARTYDPET